MANLIFAWMVHIYTALGAVAGDYVAPDLRRRRPRQVHPSAQLRAVPFDQVGVYLRPDEHRVYGSAEGRPVPDKLVILYDRINGEPPVNVAVDNFYRKVLSDYRINRNVFL